MHIANCFPGDDYRELADAQHDEYWELVPYILIMAQAAYDAAEALVDQSTVLGIVSRGQDGFDHRTLQDVHDWIAAKYRRDVGPSIVQPELTFYHKTERARLRSKWRSYFKEELSALVREPSFTRNVLIATAHQNEPLGYESERALVAFVKRRYGFQGPADH